MDIHIDKYITRVGLVIKQRVYGHYQGQIQPHPLHLNSVISFRGCTKLRRDNPYTHAHSCSEKDVYWLQYLYTSLPTIAS